MGTWNVDEIDSEAVFLVVYDPSVNELWATNLAPVNELWNTEILEFLVRSDSQIFDLWANFVGLTFKRKSRSQQNMPRYLFELESLH